MPDIQKESAGVTEGAASLEMTAEALEAIRENLHLSQAAMAKMVQCDLTGYKRYATGTRQIPRYIARSAHLIEFIRLNGLQKKLTQYLRDK